jgi:hypothetical protein
MVSNLTYVVEIILNGLALLMAFFDLVVEVSETFGFLVLSLIFFLSQINLLNLLHSTTKKSPSQLLVPNLYLINTFARVSPSVFLWLNFKN